MLIKDYKKYLNLSRVLNSTFGDSPNHGEVATQSISFKLMDDGLMKCNFIMIANFGSDTHLREMKQRYKNEAKAMLKAGLEKIKEDYKTLFPKESGVKFDVLEDTENEDVEFLNPGSFFNSRKAYFRYAVLVEVA